MSHSSVYAADTFVASAGSSLHLLRQQPAAADGATASGSGSGGPPLNLSDVVVQHPCAVNTVRWNRNNKVVAAGCADGTIQLLYSTGVVMCVLPRDGTPPAALGSISSLSWSAGSKRLAAGSSNGNAYVFDMQNKVGAGCMRGGFRDGSRSGNGGKPPGSALHWPRQPAQGAAVMPQQCLQPVHMRARTPTYPWRNPWFAPPSHQACRPPARLPGAAPNGGAGGAPGRGDSPGVPA